MYKIKAQILYYLNIVGYLLTAATILIAAITLEWGLLVLGITVLLCNGIGWSDVQDLRKNPDWINMVKTSSLSETEVLDSDGKKIT